MWVMARANLSRATDAELLQLTPVNADAFGVFYERFERDVLAFFWRRTRRADLSADLAAEVFATALGSAGTFDPGRGSARAWLFGIARHLLADTWERGRVENQARERLGIGPLVVSDETLESIERLDAAQSGVLDLLDELPDGQRAAVDGRIVGDSDYAELATRLMCSRSVVRQRVRRGLRALHDRLQARRSQNTTTLQETP
jgi:RNA polymerase sigma-70 factor (ECF subfamily)